MSINNIKFPYHRNVPDESGNLKVITEWISHEDYIKYLHIDPLKHLSIVYNI